MTNPDGTDPLDALRSPAEMREQLAEQLRRANRHSEHERKAANASTTTGSDDSIFAAIGETLGALADKVGDAFSSIGEAVGDAFSGSGEGGGSDGGGGDGGGGGD